MGVTHFWNTVDDEGECVNLFQLASDHIQQNGKPYRIAIDTPYWLFKNLDEESVQAIRELSHRASNPNEKAILYRLMRFACHGIQVCLVFDGPGRPAKRGKNLTVKSHALISQRLLLLREAAQKLGVMCWDAPAEAEAECANMLRSGVVDAIWSEDSDVFLFRGEALLRFHYDKPGKKDNVMAQRYRISSIAEKFKLMDWRGVILFAILVGGDYDVRGLPGCGPKIALKAVGKGLGALLIDAFKLNKLDMWRRRFREFLDKSGSKVPLPANFPDPGVLKNYIDPQVSSAEALQSRIQWDLAIDQPSLKVLIIARFNFSVQEYIRWVVRMLLSRRLLAGPLADVHELDLQLTRGVSTKESGNINLSRVSFLVGSIVPSKAFLETWPVKDTIAENRIKPYTHEDRIECDLPDSIIGLAAPELLKDKTSGKPKTTKADPPGGHRKRGRPRKDPVRLGDLKSDLAPGRVSLKRKRGRPRKLESDDRNRMSVGPRRDDTSLVNGTVSVSKSHTASAQYIHGTSSEDDQNDEFPDLLDLVSNKSTMKKTGMETRMIKKIDSSRRAMNESARLELPPNSFDVLQKENRPPRQSDMLREFVSEVGLRDELGSHRRKHQEATEGESWAQPVDLTCD